MTEQPQACSDDLFFLAEMLAQASKLVGISIIIATIMGSCMSHCTMIKQDELRRYNNHPYQAKALNND